MTYDAQQIARELTDTALGYAFNGNALRVAKDIPCLMDDDRAVLDRFATGQQNATDHIRLQEIAIWVRGLALTWRAQGEANEYVLMDGTRWIAAVKQNGEMLVAKQEANMCMWAAAPEMLRALRELQANPNDPRAHRVALNAIALAMAAA